MTMLNIEDSLIVVIDIQDKLLQVVYNKDLCEKKAVILSNTANILGIPVIVTEQYPKGLGNTIDKLQKSLPVNTKYYEKTSFSALENLEILDAIKNSGKKQIVIFGIEAHICVSQTTSALLDLGYDVHVVKDACGSRAETDYLAGLERMKDYGAHIVTTEIALFEWLKSSKNENFKLIQSLIK